jgi:anti-sigma regulatory factor (Ser/Thr protein kinase)
VEETYGPARGHDVHTAPQTRPVETAVAACPEPPTLIDQTFGRNEITMIRHRTDDALRSVGLGGDRLQGFVLAVNEVITNVVLHAGGHGRIVLWLTGGSAWCTVTDSGPGIPDHLLRPAEMPETFGVGGRGIWLAYQLCDEVRAATGPIGTTIGMRIALPGCDQASDQVNDPLADT